MNHPTHRPAFVLAVPVLAAVLVAILAAGTAAAQPFGAFSVFDPASSSHYRVPHHPALNPPRITLEGWVSLQPVAPGVCRSIMGKNYQETWWVGHCGTTLRSFIRGVSSVRDAGTIADNLWHHFAVTYDGLERCHYIDGVQAACWTEPGPALPTNTDPVLIGRDVSWGFAPGGALNELRIWSFGFSQAEVRESLKVPLTSALPGLVAVWSSGGPDDALGFFDASEIGSIGILTFPVTGFPCSNSSTRLCLHDRFEVTVRWRTSSDEGMGRLTPLVSTQSGVFWFFNPTNWELMVKVLAGCPVNNRWWVFSAASTNVFYRIQVFDRYRGAQKIYFNYAGPPAPALTDTGALATCP